MSNFGTLNFRFLKVGSQTKNTSISVPYKKAYVQMRSEITRLQGVIQGVPTLFGKQEGACIT